jgi:ArsR family transcriptional regulator
MSTSPKLKLYEEFASVARALGNAHRLDIIEHLGQGERGVDALSAKVGLSTANTSQHLQQLKRAGLVESRRDGKYILYRVSDDNVLDLMRALFDVGERNVAEVDKVLRGYFHERDNMEPVSHEDLLDRTRDGLVTVLDVRPKDEFALGHLPGAVNIPLDELESRLSELL